MRELEGRTAIITGANQGLGAEIARSYVAAGASVLICARTLETLVEVQKHLQRIARPGQIILVRKADVAVATEVQSLVDYAVQHFTRIDILVNNAGVYGPFGNLEDVDVEQWMSAVAINLFGTVHCCRAVLPGMRAAGAGKIINVSGGGATSPLPGISSYASAKAAVVRLTETLALETASAGIDVNAIAPGALATRLLDEVLEAGPDKVGKAFHEKMMSIRNTGGTPLEIGAKLCVFLGSSKSDGITGKLIAAQWDKWADWPNHLDALSSSDVYTLRRIAGRDRGMEWGDV